MIDSGSTSMNTLIIANQDFNDGGLTLRKDDICCVCGFGSGSNLPVHFYILKGKGLKTCHHGSWNARKSHFDYYLDKECGRVIITEFEGIERTCKFVPYSLVDYLDLNKLGINPGKENKITVYIPIEKMNDIPDLVDCSSENKCSFMFNLYCKLDSSTTPKEIMDTILKQLDNNGIYVALKGIIEANHNTGKIRNNTPIPDICIRFGKLVIVATEKDVFGSRFEQGVIK